MCDIPTGVAYSSGHLVTSHLVLAYASCCWDQPFFLCHVFRTFKFWIIVSIYFTFYTSGWLYDDLGSYKVPFLLAGCSTTVSALLMILPRYRLSSHKRHSYTLDKMPHIFSINVDANIHKTWNIINMILKLLFSLTIVVSIMGATRVSNNNYLTSLYFLPRFTTVDREGPWHSYFHLWQTPRFQFSPAYGVFIA